MTDAATPGPETGAWFVYGRDWNEYPIGLFGDELEARRSVANTFDHVVFWPFGKAWGDVDHD